MNTANRRKQNNGSCLTQGEEFHLRWFHKAGFEAFNQRRADQIKKEKQERLLAMG